MPSARINPYPLLAGLTVIAAISLSGCSTEPTSEPIDRNLSGYLFSPVGELPTSDSSGNIAVEAIYQDVQRDIDPASDVPVGNMVGWVIVAICGDASEAGDRLTEFQASIIPEELLTDDVRGQAESGDFTAPLECSEDWTQIP